MKTIFVEAESLKRSLMPMISVHKTSRAMDFYEERSGGYLDLASDN